MNGTSVEGLKDRNVWLTEQVKDLEKKLALAEGEVIKRGEHCNELIEKLAEVLRVTSNG